LFRLFLKIVISHYIESFILYLFFTDIDECVAQTHDCSPNADCTNADEHSSARVTGDLQEMGKHAMVGSIAH